MAAAAPRDPATGEETKMTVKLAVYCDPELKDVAGKEADKENLPLSEWIVRAMAEKAGRPDLAKVPRKAYGRPRKTTNGNGSH